MSVLRRAGHWLIETGSVLWRCLYSFVLTLAGALAFIVIPQGRELLRLLDESAFHIASFVLGLVIWALSAWYCARVALRRRFGRRAPVDRSRSRAAAGLRVWLPRALALLPGLVIGGGALAAQAPRAGAACLAGTAAVALLITRRRRWFGLDPDPAARSADLERTTRNVLLAMLVGSFALFLGVLAAPLAIAAVLPAATLLCLAIACWIVFGQIVLIYSFKHARLPSMALLPAVLFVLFSPWNDNHRLAPAPAGPAPALPRPALAAHLHAWLAARAARGELVPGRPYQVYLVAAAGGGIRAAQWTALVLGRLQDGSRGRFGRHLFGVSGVSGGSLGAATFAALMADDAAGALARRPCAAVPGRAFEACAGAAMDRDYLSPLAGFLLYPDLVQRFLPVPIGAFDRSRALEDAWRAGWHAVAGSDRFGQPFAQLWATHPDRVPALFLNATLVDQGNRVIASNVQVDPATFIGAYDEFSPLLDTANLSLAGAVHNSARFAYVSPAGLVMRRDGTAWGRLIDGGYFENSGVETARDLLRAIEQADTAHQLRVTVLEISNDPGELSPDDPLDVLRAPPPGHLMPELTAPVLGLFRTRTARASFAERANRRDVFPGQVIRFDMKPGTDIALGWTLSRPTRARILARADELQPLFNKVEELAQ